MKLTNDNIRTLPMPSNASGDALYPDTDQKNGVPGLYVRVRTGGSRSFIIQWRQGQFRRRTTIGKVGVLSLDEARKRARKTLVGIDEGNDPIAAKAKTRADGSQLFLPIARQYLDARAKDMKPLSLDQCRRHLEDYWKPLHKHALSKIERAIVAAELRTLAKERGPVAADRSRSTLSAFFAWSIGEGYCENNPVMGTNKASKDKSRERVLTDAELVAIWNAAPEGDYGTIVKLLMLTAQRRDEIAALERTEIDTDQLLIALPAARTKNSRAHDVPLSANAWSLLETVPKRDKRAHVFGDGQGGYSGFSRAKDTLDGRCKVKDWTLHDLRRTAATRMADLGVQPHVIEAVLNHVSGHKSGVAGIYNRSTYAAEKRAALDLWGSHVMTIVAQADGANVTRLTRKKDAAT